MNMQAFAFGLIPFLFFAWVGTLVSEAPIAVVWALFALLALVTAFSTALGATTVGLYS